MEEYDFRLTGKHANKDSFGRLIATKKILIDDRWVAILVNLLLEEGKVSTIVFLVAQILAELVGVAKLFKNIRVDKSHSSLATLVLIKVPL